MQCTPKSEKRGALVPEGVPTGPRSPPGPSQIPTEVDLGEIWGGEKVDFGMLLQSFGRYASGYLETLRGFVVLVPASISFTFYSSYRCRAKCGL